MEMKFARVLPLLCCLGITGGWKLQERGDFSEITLRGDAIARHIQNSLQGAKGEFDADRWVGGKRLPGSYLQLGPALGDRRFEFSVPERTVDLSYAGSIIYRVHHIKLGQVRVSSENGEFVVRASFTTSGVALKGAHSTLGDAAVPDIRLDNMRLIVRLTPVVTPEGRITYDRPAVKFTADVDNTFLPRFNILGRTVDVLDALTNYRRDLCRSIESGIQKALDNPAGKAALAAKIDEGIAGEITGPQSPISSLRFHGTDLVVRLRGRG